MSSFRLPLMLARFLGAAAVMMAAVFTFGLTNGDVVLQAILLAGFTIVAAMCVRYLTRPMNTAWQWHELYPILLIALGGMTFFLVGNQTGTAPSLMAFAVFVSVLLGWLAVDLLGDAHVQWVAVGSGLLLLLNLLGLVPTPVNFMSGIGFLALNTLALVVGGLLLTRRFAMSGWHIWAWTFMAVGAFLAYFVLPWTSSWHMFVATVVGYSSGMAFLDLVAAMIGDMPKAPSTNHHTLAAA